MWKYRTLVTVMSIEATINKTQNLALQGVSAAILVACIVGVFGAWVKRNFWIGLILFLLGSFAFYMCLNPDSFKTIGGQVFDGIFS